MKKQKRVLIIIGVVIALIVLVFLFIKLKRSIIGSDYPKLYRGVVIEKIDDNTVIVEQTGYDEGNGELIEVTYDELKNYNKHKKNVTLSVGDEVWFDIWSKDDLTEKDGKRYIKTEYLSVNEGGKLCSACIKEIIDDNTLVVTESYAGVARIGEEFTITFDRYEISKGEEYIEIEPELGDYIDITYNEESIEKNGDGIKVKCVRVIAKERDNIGAEDILFITDRLWLEGEIIERGDDNSFIVQAAIDNEHIAKGEKVVVMYEKEVLDSLDLTLEECFDKKLRIGYYSYTVEKSGGNQKIQLDYMTEKE